MAWGMPQQQTETVCNRLRGLNRPCEVLSPEAVQQFQRQALEERTTRPQPAAAKSAKRKVRNPTKGGPAKAAKTAPAKVSANGAGEDGDAAKGDQ